MWGQFAPGGRDDEAADLVGLRPVLTHEQRDVLQDEQSLPRGLVGPFQLDDDEVPAPVASEDVDEPLAPTALGSL